MKRKPSFQWTAQDAQSQSDAVREPDESPVSRSEKKRRALALQNLGEKVLHLEHSLLENLELPDEFMKAVCEYAKIPSREAQRRQRQHVGKLMRSLDPETVERLKNIASET